MDKQRLAESRPPRWTSAEDYVVALARRRTARKARVHRVRTGSEPPHFLLSTFPFLALIGALAVLSVAIMIAAFPGSQPVAKAPAPAPRVQGVASRGWFQEAQKEFHR